MGSKTYRNAQWRVYIAICLVTGLAALADFTDAFAGEGLRAFPALLSLAFSASTVFALGSAFDLGRTSLAFAVRHMGSLEAVEAERADRKARGLLWRVRNPPSWQKALEAS